MRCMRRPAGETEIQLCARLNPTDGSSGSRKAPEAIRMFVAWSLHRPGAELPKRPPPQQD
jgi:hypothetical protein